MISINSVSNDKIKLAAHLAASAEERRNCGLFVVHGVKLSLEALRSGFVIRTVFVTEKALSIHSDELQALMQSTQECYLVGENVEKKLTDQRTPQGVVCVVEKRENRSPASNRVAVLCSVQDPANVGTVTRSALAFGFDLILAAGCADLWSPKTLRASMGASMKIKAETATDEFEALELVRQRGYSTYATSLSGSPQPLTGISPAEKSAIFIGSEGQGLDEELCEKCDHTLIIPISSAVESLNAAAAATVLFWHFRGDI